VSVRDPDTVRLEALRRQAKCETQSIGGNIAGRMTSAPVVIAGAFSSESLPWTSSGVDTGSREEKFVKTNS
jgi:hypothetical protein